MCRPLGKLQICHWVIAYYCSLVKPPCRSQELLVAPCDQQQAWWDYCDNNLSGKKDRFLPLTVSPAPLGIFSKWFFSVVGMAPKAPWNQGNQLHPKKMSAGGSKPPWRLRLTGFLDAVRKWRAFCNRPWGLWDLWDLWDPLPHSEHATFQVMHFCWQVIDGDPFKSTPKQNLDVLCKVGDQWV